MTETRYSVFLADLRHDYQGYLTSDAMPLGIGYLKSILDVHLPGVTSKMFVYPSELVKELDRKVPDVFLATNYVWNESLNQHFAKVIKQRNPHCLVIVGGPNIPIEDFRKVEYLRSRPFIDLYVTGEGEWLAAELIGSFVELDGRIDALLNKRWHSSAYLNPSSGDFVVSEIRPRSSALDEIPSPWLNGVMDQFFDGKLAPLLETNRGCPFTCTFCVQGTKWYTKVNYFSTDRVKAELDRIGQLISEKCPDQKVLRIADPNFGMYERDIEISEHIGRVQTQYDWPLLIDATTGKNRADRIIQSMEKVNGALMMYQAVQSLDDEVLENVKRQNIRLETYEQIQAHVRGRGLRSSSDLILGLPGETLQSHLTSLRKLVNSGTHKLNNFQSMMLKGSELETLDVRNRHGFQTKFRLVPKNFGEYFGIKVFDTEEIIVSTDTLSFDDYLTARTYHFAINLFWNESRFEQIVAFAGRHGITAWEWVESLASALTPDCGELFELKQGFLEETRNELFDTTEAAERFYSTKANFAKLLSNEIGDNLVYKYRAIASFLMWPSVCQLVFRETKHALLSRSRIRMEPGFHEFWADVERFYTARYAHGQSSEDLLRDHYEHLNYNVGKWLSEGCDDNVSKYMFPAPVKLRFYLSESNRRNVEGALNIWSFNPKSISMLVRRVHNDWRAMEWEAFDMTASGKRIERDGTLVDNI
jgi:radical SAM superfamily enzyme YgiQ (UPF0313 family)